jgi:uncharacterized protein (TIGR02145 family)
MSLVCDIPWGKGLYKLQTISIRFPGCGYYLRWYYNGWHYWFFLPGRTIFQTEGEKYRTLGTRKVSMGSGQITAGECAAIRTIMNTNEVYIYTDSGWGNVRIEPGTLVVYDNQINGYEIEVIAILGSRAVSVVTGYTPIQDIPVVPPFPVICEVIIGTQIWSCKNYDIAFPGSKVYDNDEDNRAIFGGMYTFNQAIIAGFVPSGWHLPTLAEWETLIAYLGGDAVAGGKLKEIGTTHWNSPNTGAIDNYDFASLGAGYAYSNVFTGLLVFGGLLDYTFYLTASLYSETHANVIRLDYDSAAIQKTVALVSDTRISVRLIKDTPAPVYPSFSDWFLPSKDELNAMYNELYLHGVGLFADLVYWSSSEDIVLPDNFSQEQDFSTGIQDNGLKTNIICVRACRAFTSLTSYSLRDIGEAGGLIFWKSGNDYLEAAPTDQSIAHTWSNITAVRVTGTATAIGTGQANTTAIIGQIGHTDSAAKLCDDYVS